MADPSSYPIQSLLALDLGTATTRATLFDVVEGTYRFVACGEAPSTFTPPYQDVTEGMRHALEGLQNVTGRVMIDQRAQLILPTAPDGSGVDVLVLTASGGPPLRTLLIGLLPDVSVDVARRVSGSAYLSIVDTFSLADRRRDEQRFDAVLKAQPDVILVAGGTDDGARDALLKIIDTVSLACHMLPPAAQIHVLFVGNSALKDKIAEALGGVTVVHAAPNALPDLGEPLLSPARAELAVVFSELRSAQVGGFQELVHRSGQHALPTAQAVGHAIRYLNKMLKAAGGVLAVDVGSAATFLAAAIKNELYLDVRPDLGLGVSALGVLAETPLEQMMNWLPFDIQASDLRDFVRNKSLYPHTIPADSNDVHLEYALARQAIRACLRRARAQWPASARAARADLLPWFDLIVASGAAFSRAPQPGVAALLLLDALMPTAITTLFLDPHHVAAALGAIAQVNPIAAVQAIESGAFLNLGMAVSVVGQAGPGKVVCQAKLVTEAGFEQAVEVRSGTLEILPLPVGQEGKLSLKPRPGFDVGFGPGRGKTVPVLGGMVGVIIDARGRPIVFPSNAEKRREAIQGWMTKAGGAL